MRHSNTDIEPGPARTLAAYARAVDDRDLDGLANAVVDDVEIVRAVGRARGRNEFLEVYRTYWAGGQALSRHYVTNLESASAGAGVLAVRAYFAAVNFWPDRTVVVFGRYDDRLVESGGRLLFARKDIAVDRTLVLPVADPA